MILLRQILARIFSMGTLIQRECPRILSCNRCPDVVYLGLKAAIP